MKFVDLKKSLKENIKPAYLLCGDDVFLLYKSLDLIENACTPNMPEFNKVVFGEDSSYTVQDVVESLQALPIGDVKRLVLIKDLNLKNTKENLSGLNDYLKNPNPDSCLVLFCSDQNELAEKLVGVEKVDCNRLDELLVKKLVLQKVNELEKAINPDALQLLCDYTCRNLFRAFAEAEKLAAFIGEEKLITKELVENNVVKELEFQGYEFSQAVAAKNSQKAFEILNAMLAQPSNIGTIISALYSQFSRMFFVRTSNETQGEMAKIFGCKEFAVKKLAELSAGFSKRSLKNIVEKISQLEFEMKSGQISSEALCERLVFEIISVL